MSIFNFLTNDPLYEEPKLPSARPSKSRIWKVLPAPVMSWPGGWAEGSYQIEHWDDDEDTDSEMELLEVLRSTWQHALDNAQMVPDANGEVVLTIVATANDGKVRNMRIETMKHDPYAVEPVRN